MGCLKSIILYLLKGKIIRDYFGEKQTVLWIGLKPNVVVELDTPLAVSRTQCELL